MNSKLHQILGLRHEDRSDDYSFSISNPRLQNNHEMHMGAVFAILVPKDPISAKFRGYKLHMSAVQLAQGHQ